MFHKKSNLVNNYALVINSTTCNKLKISFFGNSFNFGECANKIFVKLHSPTEKYGEIVLWGENQIQCNNIRYMLLSPTG